MGRVIDCSATPGRRALSPEKKCSPAEKRSEKGDFGGSSHRHPEEGRSANVSPRGSVERRERTTQKKELERGKRILKSTKKRTRGGRKTHQGGTKKKISTKGKRFKRGEGVVRPWGGYFNFRGTRSRKGVC